MDWLLERQDAIQGKLAQASSAARSDRAV